MKKQLVILLPLFVLLLSACNNSDELSGKTFDASSPSLDSPDKYYSIMTLEFLDGKVITNSIDGVEGTYELKDDELVIQFENKNENLEILFTLKESAKDFSEYSAVISDVDFEMIDTDKISYFKNLIYKLNKDMSFEFVKK